MLSYTLMLIDPVGFINTGQHGQHCQKPYTDRSAENIVSVTPLEYALALGCLCNSRVPMLGCWAMW